MAEDVSAAHAVGTIALWSRDYKAWRSLPSGSSVLDLRYEDVVDDLDGTLTLTLTLTRTLTLTPTRTRPLTPTLTLTLTRHAAPDRGPCRTHRAAR